MAEMAELRMAELCEAQWQKFGQCSVLLCELVQNWDKQHVGITSIATLAS